MEIGRLTSRIQNFTAVERQVLSLNEKVDDLNMELHKVKGKYEKLQTVHSAQGVKMKALESKCSFLDLEIAARDQRIQSLTTEHETLLKENNRLRIDLDDCHNASLHGGANKSITSNDHDFLTESLIKEREELSCRLQAISSELERTQLALQRQTDVSNKEVTTLRIDCEELSSKLSILQIDFEKSKENNATLQQILDTLNQENMRLSGEQRELETKREELESALVAAEESLQESSAVVDENRSLKKATEDLASQLETVMGELERTRLTLQQQNHVSHEEVTSLRSERDDLLSKLTSLQSDFQKLKEVNAVLDQSVETLTQDNLNLNKELSVLMATNCDLQHQLKDMEEREACLREESASFFKEISSLKANRDELSNEVAALSAKCTNVEENFASLNEEMVLVLEESRSLKANHEELSKKVAVLNAQCASDEEKLTCAKEELHYVLEENRSLKAHRSELSNQVSTLRAQNANEQEKLTAVREEFELALMENRSLKEENASLEASLSAAKAEVEKERICLRECQQCYSEELETLHQELLQRDRHHGSELDALRCEECQLQQELEEKQRRIEKLGADLESTRRDWMDTEQKRQKLEDELNSIDTYKTKYEDAMAEVKRMSECCSSVESLHTALNELDAMLMAERSAKEDCEREMALMKQRLTRAQTEREEWKQTMAMYKVSMENAQAQLEQQTREYAGLERDSARLLDVEARLRALQQDYDSLQSKYESAQTELMNAQDECRSQRDRNECLKQRCEVLQSHMSHLERVGVELKSENQEFRHRSNISSSLVPLRARMDCEDEPEEAYLECKRPGSLLASRAPKVAAATSAVNAQFDDADLLNTSHAWRERLNELRSCGKTAATKRDTSPGAATRHVLPAVLHKRAPLHSTNQDNESHHTSRKVMKMAIQETPLQVASSKTTISSTSSSTSGRGYFAGYHIHDLLQKMKKKK